MKKIFLRHKIALRCIVIVLFAPLLLLLVLDLCFPFKIIDNYSLLITDKDGNAVHAFLSSDDKWRMECFYDELPEDIVKAIVHKEDKYFYWHPGVNPAALTRAFFQNISSGKIESGASTITMQVARILEQRPRTFRSKFIEVFRALQLELHLSKKEILRLYLNRVPYGGNIEGVKAASLLYFGQMPEQLSLAQVAVLSSIPNNPNGLRPGSNDNALLAKRNQLLLRFKKGKVFLPEIIDDALREPLQAQRRNAPNRAEHYSWVLRKRNPDAALLSGTIDMSKQLWLEKKVAQYAATIRRKGAENMAVLIVRNSDRSVVSWQGSANFDEENYHGQVDGVRAVRSPGSALKPLIYAIAYDKGVMTPKTILCDLSINHQGYAPQNYDGKFNGEISAQEALALSLNIPSVSLLKEIGVQSAVSKLIACDFKTVAKKKDMIGLSLALGGCGCSLFELVGLYSSFANGGIYAPLKIIQNQQDVKKDTIISSEAAFVITEILTGLHRPDLPNGWEFSSGIPRIAWKTGTSYGRRDAWAVGYNPDYTIGVWIGNFLGTSIPELNGSEYAVPLLFDLFRSMPEEKTGSWFIPPAGVDYRVVCTESGLPPSDFCTSIATDYYKPGVSPSERCRHLVDVFINADSTISYCRDCYPEVGYKIKKYRNMSPELTAFYEEKHIPFEKIPPHNQQCTKVFKGKEPVIKSPEPVDYFLENGQQLMLSCMAENDVQYVYWFINNRYCGKCARQETIFVTPPAGKCKITVSDDKGRKSEVEITVTYI